MTDEIAGTLFGRHFRVRGRDIFPWLLVLLLIFACAYLVDFAVNKWGTPIDLGRTIIQLQQQTADQHDSIHVSVETRLDELTYILSLTQEERARLHISMPPTLRNRLYKGGQ